MNKKLENKIQNDIEFQDIIKDLTQNKIVQQMKKYRQHCNTDCFEHCYMASYYCYLICKKLKLDYKSAARAGMVHDLFLYDWRGSKKKLKLDYKSAARGAMLHDLFLYDWRQKNGRKGLHAFTHPKYSYENASKIFALNQKEKDIIIKHMWPVTPVPPRYMESFILTLVDKHCTLNETINYIIKKKS